MDPHLEEWTGRLVHVQREGFVLDCLIEPMEQSELLLRNKVDNKVEEPVSCKKAAKAQSCPLPVWDIVCAGSAGVEGALLR